MTRYPVPSDQQRAWHAMDSNEYTGAIPAQRGLASIVWTYTCFEEAAHACPVRKLWQGGVYLWL